MIIIYVEAISDLEKFKAACRMARAAGKYDRRAQARPVGRRARSAAMAHTGSLAGSVEAFDAVAGEVGVIRADTLDDAVEITELLVHTGAPAGRRLGAVTLSGAFRGLLLDAAERNGLEFPRSHPATTDRLNAVLTVGSLVSNPIDGGFGVLSSADNFMASIDALQADPNVDMVLVQEGSPRAPGSDRAEHYIALVDDYAATRATKPIAFVHADLHGQTDYSRALRAEVAARVVPAGGQQGAARDRQRGAARRAASGWPRGRRRTPRADAGSATSIERLRSARDARGRARSTRPNPRRCCAPTASPRRRKPW